MFAKVRFVQNLFNKNQASFFIFKNIFNSSSSIQNPQKYFDLLLPKLKIKAQYISQLQQKMQSQDSSPKQQIQLELNKHAGLRQLYEDAQGCSNNISDIQNMIKEMTDKDEIKLMKEEQMGYENRKKQIVQEAFQFLLPDDVYDDASEIKIQIRPGAGGTESSIFVQDIGQMFMSFFNLMGWSHTILTNQKQIGVTRGYKLLVIKVVGANSHKILKSESGVHKVIRVPETESKGRLHSSTISVVIMPIVPFNFQVEAKDIRYQFTRSQGPGGQGVNKTESACRAIHIPTSIQVLIQESRSQDTNKKRATEILKERIFQIEYEKNREEEVVKRKSQVTTMDRSEKIRTYNYQQDRITDHRTGLTKFGINEMMQGEYIMDYVDSYSQKIKQEKVKMLVQQLESLRQANE